jgi:hypothetical protein
VIVANEIYKAEGYEMVITSINDSNHSLRSCHYSGEAIDLRVKNLPRQIWEAVTQKIKSNLTVDYDVILELQNPGSEHIHIEYDPK